MPASNFDCTVAVKLSSFAARAAKTVCAWLSARTAISPLAEVTEASSEMMVEVLSRTIPTPMAIAPDRLAIEPAEASAMAVTCVLPLVFNVTPSAPDKLALSPTLTVARFSVAETAATNEAPAELDCDRIVLCVSASALTLKSPEAVILLAPSIKISEVE